MSRYDYPLVVIGAGAGGLVIAIGVAKAGKRVLLVERGPYGGDCTNFGCIPSKSLIASAHAAHAIKHGNAFGLRYEAPDFDSAGALQRTRNIVAMIRKEESPPVLEEMGIETLTGTATFVDPHTLEVVAGNGNVKKITAGNIVIATGSRPTALPIPGLEEVPYLNNESVFAIDKVPETLAIIGGGAIGCELAQAFSRLGATVTVLEFFDHLLIREEPEVHRVIETCFSDEGITCLLGYKTNKVRASDGNIVLDIENRKNGQAVEVSASKLLIAVGRHPNCDHLLLESAGVQYSKQGIVVDAYGRTTNKNIWAIGDVTGGAMFTHVAENEGRTVLTNLLNPLPWPFKKKRDTKQAVPRVTYTDPEVASVGITEEQAIEQLGANKVATYHVPFSGVDRAITTGRIEGFVKVVTKKWSSKILGATIVAPRAGEMLAEVTCAMHNGIPLRKLASLIHAYPTYSLAIRKAADQWLTKTIFPTLMKLTGKS